MRQPQEPALMAVAGGGDWIRQLHRAPDARIVLLCLPHAGGSASFYFPLSRALTPEIEVLAVQYPGRQDRRNEASVDEIPVLADRITDALRGWDRRRIALFGHSMGATVAFEVVRRLERDGPVGPSPVRLIASARRAPALCAGTSVHRHDDNGMVAELQRLSGTATALFADRELLGAFLPALRADYKAIETYACPPGAMIRCPVTAFVGKTDPLTSREQAAAWREHTGGGFDLRTFPGGHFYLDGWQDGIVSEIRRCLTL